MKISSYLLSVICFFSISTLGWCVDHTVEPLKEPAPTGELAKDVADQLSAEGVRVSRGSATYCDIWLCKTWAGVKGFKVTPEVAYPFPPGQLIGVIKVNRKGSDFRDQDINPGLYTLRYAQQPVDGAHVGTSLTRDFLLLTEAGKDKSSAVVDPKVLAKQSAEAAGSSHPLLLSMQKPSAESTEFPAIRHNEEHDWWIVSARGQAQGDKGAMPAVMDVVIAGKAAE
jgi:hypothetical protein